MTSPNMPTRTDATCHFRFQAIADIFVDYAANATHDSSFRATTLPSLGLLERPYPTDYSDVSGEVELPWIRFKAYIDQLNAEEAGGARYKVLYITRHGLGYHNTFEAQVGRDAWNNHWSHLPGNGEITWEDAHLIQEGVEQAQQVGQLYADAFRSGKLPIPGTIYTSPLARCLETTKLVFEPGMKQQGAEFRPVVKELLRERLTDHTCDKRSSRTWITKHYPSYVLEPSLSEEDELWSSERWETNEEHVARKQRLLEEIFDADDNAFIALTTHSYAVSAILEVVGMNHFRVREGSSIALLVKGEKIGKDR